MWPNSRRACRAASSGGRPRRIRSAARSSRWWRNSSAISASTSSRRRWPRQSERNRASRPCMSYLLWSGAQRHRDGLGQAVPARHLIAQTLPPRRGQSVVLRPSVVLAHSPLALDASPVLEAVERRVERALLDLESATRDLLDTEQHAIPVQLAEGEGLQDQEVEGAGKEFRGIGHDSLLVELGESVIPTLLS